VRERERERESEMEREKESGWEGKQSARASVAAGETLTSNRSPHSPLWGLGHSSALSSAPGHSGLAL
jgi:hypothetical protein